MDAALGPDGSFYVLEYGTQWNTANPNAAVSRIDYQGTCLPVTSTLRGRQGKRAGYSTGGHAKNLTPTFSGAFPDGLTYRLDGRRFQMN